MPNNKQRTTITTKKHEGKKRLKHLFTCAVHRIVLKCRIEAYNVWYMNMWVLTKCWQMKEKYTETTTNFRFFPPQADWIENGWKQRMVYLQQPLPLYGTVFLVAKQTAEYYMQCEIFLRLSWLCLSATNWLTCKKKTRKNGNISYNRSKELQSKSSHRICVLLIFMHCSDNRQEAMKTPKNHISLSLSVFLCRVSSVRLEFVLAAVLAFVLFSICWHSCRCLAATAASETFIYLMLDIVCVWCVWVCVLCMCVHICSFPFIVWKTFFYIVHCINVNIFVVIYGGTLLSQFALLQFISAIFHCFVLVVVAVCCYLAQGTTET